MQRWSRIWLAALMTLAAVAIPTASAGALSIIPSSIGFPAVTLGGTAQTVLGSTDAWRADGTGTADGWNVTVSSTDFEGAGRSIPVSNFRLRLTQANVVVASGDTNGPSSTVTEFSALSGSPLKIASAAALTGDGVYDLTPEVRLTIPAGTYAGSYSATIIVAINNGP